jgi:hypothetical protein
MFQLTNLNDLSHNDDVISNVNDISDDKIDIVDVEAGVDDVNSNVGIVNVDNGDVFNKYKPTTTSPYPINHNIHGGDDDDDINNSHQPSYPTRPSRPTKPTVRWPTFQATASHLSSQSLNDDDGISTTTASSTSLVDVTHRSNYVHFPQAVTRPTKQPPPLQGKKP